MEGTPDDDAIEVGSPNIPWSLWTTCVEGGNDVTDESRVSELEGGASVEGGQPPGISMREIIIRDTQNKPVSDISNISAVTDQAREAMLGKVASEVFRYKPFIVLEEELEIDEPVARMFFKEAKLDGDNDKNKQERRELWINKNYKNKL